MWYINGAMKRYYFKIFLSLVFIISAAFFLTGCSLPGQKPKQSALSINSIPKSTVFLEDKHVGQTPFYDEKLKPGEYLVKLMPETEATAASSWSKKIKLNPETLTVINREFGQTEEESAGEILSLEFLGRKKSAELAVLTRPDNTEIKIDGSLKGNSPLIVTDIKEGDHEIEISLTNYLSRKVKIKTVNNYRITVSVDLSRKIGAENLTPTPSVKSTITPTPGKAKTTITPTIAPTPTTSSEEEATSAGEKTLEIGTKIVVNDTGVKNDQGISILNVRTEPKQDSSRITEVTIGQEFTILDKSGLWLKIEYEKDKQGWIYSGDNYVSAK